MIDEQRRHLSGRREQVIHEAGVDDLSLFIVNQALEKGSADALGHASMDLSLDHDWIDDAPAVMHGGVLHEGNITGGGVNLDNRAMNATGETAMRRAVEGARLQAGTATFLRQRRTRTRPGQLHR